MSLASNVRALRTSAHLSVPDLAKVTGLTPALIRSFESGAVDASAGEVQAIGRHFGVSEAMLRGE
jgi:transcriptional regulator with XRE-family HTH domain